MTLSTEVKSIRRRVGDNGPGMATRAETTAATRTALLEAAGALLDAGGPEAVTLREVGARAGVSRSAPYRHFDGKDSLLTALATQAWSSVGDALEKIESSGDDPVRKLRDALGANVAIGTSHPHLYRLMYTKPNSDPEALVRAAERSQEVYIRIVAGVVGEDRAREYAALLMTSAHGITGLENSGHLTQEKWHTDADRLLDLLVGLLPTTV